MKQDKDMDIWAHVSGDSVGVQISRLSDRCGINYLLLQEGWTMQSADRGMKILPKIICAGLLLVYGCGPKARLQGEVRDGFGVPLGGVTVEIPGTQFKAITEETGSYSVEYVPGRFRLEFLKDGYTRDQLEFDVATETVVPAAPVTLVKIPEEPGMYFFGKSDYRKVPSGKLHFATVEHAFSLNKNLYTDSYRVSGDFVLLNAGGHGKFLDSDGISTVIVEVDGDGVILVREKAWLDTKDKVTIVKESLRKIPPGLWLREAPLKPGRYAFVAVNSGASLRRGGPTFGSIEGHPLREPVYLFEVVDEVANQERKGDR